jgi:hypothetical protein
MFAAGFHGAASSVAADVRLKPDIANPQVRLQPNIANPQVRLQPHIANP